VDEAALDRPTLHTLLSDATRTRYILAGKLYWTCIYLCPSSCSARPRRGRGLGNAEEPQQVAARVRSAVKRVPM